MKLQQAQEELENQLRQKQQEIERLKAGLTKQENEDRAKYTGSCVAVSAQRGLKKRVITADVWNQICRYSFQGWNVQ